MKNFTSLICISAVILLLFASSILKSFDFDAMEGRGADKKEKVKWVFKNAKHFESVQYSLLLQRFDKIRNEPRLSVQGIYWLEGNRYLEINDVSEDAFKGQECLGFRLENYAMKCSVDNKKPVHVCQSSFLSKEKILSSKPNVSDIINKYDDIKKFFENYPVSSSQGYTYKGSDIPQPLRPYLKTHDDTLINCWVEQLEITTSKPEQFLCDASYHKCEGSSSIKIHYP